LKSIRKSGQHHPPALLTRANWFSRPPPRAWKYLGSAS